jgi:two-component system, NarL family, sensor histidine kinase DegS
MSQGTTTSSREELLAEFEEEYEKIKRRLNETQQLIEQSQLEVSRLRDRNVSVSAQLRRVEENFDILPRADIKAAYDDALDAKTRLLTMQGQLEKLRGNQEELQYFEQLLGRLLDLARGIAPEQLPSGPSRGHDMMDSEGGSLSMQAVVRIVEAQEAERKRLARQMHDGPAQSLTNFILQAEICQRLFDRNPDRAGEELTNLKTAASATFQKVRDFIFDLRPMMLDDLGLVPTIRRYVETFQEKYEIKVKLSILGEERRLPGHIEVMMFRSIQEIMGNGRDNLGARKITIVLDISGSEWIKATIDHDGQSLDLDQVFEEASRDEVSSLRTLKERIELVGGSIEVTGSLEAASPEEEFNRFVITLPGLG